MVSSQIADGEDCLQIWRVALNILNKQLQTYITYIMGSMDWINLAQDKNMWQALLNMLINL